MDIVDLNNRIEQFVKKHDLTADAPALKKEFAIGKPEEWRQVLDSLSDEGRMLRVGIIGRVKAGKSSMLNSLLFDGKDILPKAATPMTAALTIMQYSETVYATVDFFTQSDIDEIKSKYDSYVQQSESLKDAKQAEGRERALKKKSKINHSGQLSAEEIQEIEEKAVKQAEREMKIHPYFASYDQYCRIKESGASLNQFKTNRILHADSVEKLINELNEFVGANGKFMPFTKSVTLYIPEEGLKGLQIIDTPGINDPVTSRGERTEQLLQECDVVWLVSPSGQFLSSEDTDLMHRVTTKEGTQEAYIIASQVDNQLFGSEKIGLNQPVEVLEKISASLTGHARNVLNKQVQQFPSMSVAAKKLIKNQVICSSSVAYALNRYFDAPEKWDSNMQHVWGNLQHHYPEAFSRSDETKQILNKLANMDRLHGIVEEVKNNKEKILAERRVNFENDKRSALQNYLLAWEEQINGRIHQIETADVGQLHEQVKKLEAQQVEVEHQVGGVCEDLIVDIKLNMKKQLQEKLKSEVRRYQGAADDAHGSETKSKRVLVKEAAWYEFWKDDEYETHHYDVTVVHATAVRRAIEEIRSNLEDELAYIAESYMREWRKRLYAQVVSSLRQVLGDDGLDAAMIDRALKNVLAQIPDVAFNLGDGLPSWLKKSGKLRGDEAEEFISDAEDYVSDLKDTVKGSVSDYIQNLIGNIKAVNLPQELTKHLEDNLQQLVHEIDNKEASLSLYRNMNMELKTLKQEAAV